MKTDGQIIICMYFHLDYCIIGVQYQEGVFVFILNSVGYFLSMRSELSLKGINATSGITATKGAGVYDGRSLVPKATEGEVGDSVCEAPETPLVCFSGVYCVYVLDLLPCFVRVLLRNRRLFTQRVLPALLFV